MPHAARSALASAVAALVALTACSKPPPAPPAKPAQPPADAGAAKDAAREKDVLEAAIAAYVYGYPLVTAELTRRAMTNVARPAARQAPMGQLAKQRAFPTAADREAGVPSGDTLAIQAWLDVSAEPWILGVPEVKGRYLLLPLFSAFTEVFAAPGGRTNAFKAQRFAITGPGWKGKLPANVTELKSPTGLVWLAGRLSTTGTKKDLAEVHALQDRFTLLPLSSVGKKYVAPAGKVDPAVGARAGVREQVDGLDAVAYFKLLASLLKANPPAATEAAMVTTLARIGLVPGQPFDGGPLDSVALRALAAAPKAAQARIQGQAAKAQTTVNGWTLRAGGVGVYGADHLQRAYIASAAFGAVPAQDEVLATAETDGAGAPLDGAKKYALRFPKGQLPPARAFWSVTLLDGHRALAANKLNRHAVLSREKLRFNKDGSLDLHVQKDPPGKGKEANWLPAPAGPFVLVLAIHWPSEKAPTILDGSWKPPAVVVAK